jgi:hypothetical protein
MANSLPQRSNGRDGHVPQHRWESLPQKAYQSPELFLGSSTGIPIRIGVKQKVRPKPQGDGGKEEVLDREPSTCYKPGSCVEAMNSHEAQKRLGGAFQWIVIVERLFPSWGGAREEDDGTERPGSGSDTTGGHL